MIQNFDKLTIVRVAKQYYTQGLSQQEISEREFIHRSQVSRILKAAREQGIVQISISLPQNESTEVLRAHLLEKLQIADVLIAPALSPDDNGSESLALYAAHYLEDILPQAHNVGIGLGKTMLQVAKQLTFQRCENPPDFFSAVGSSGTGNSEMQNSVILERFASSCGGQCHYNNFLNYIRKSVLTDLEKKRLTRLFQAYKKFDTVIVSIGGRWKPGFPQFEEIPLDRESMAQALRREHGDLLGHIFFENGEQLELPRGYYTTSVNLELLQQAPNVICIARGEEKVWSIVHASALGYIKTLITDEFTAQKILEYDEKQH